MRLDPKTSRDSLPHEEIESQRKEAMAKRTRVLIVVGALAMIGVLSAALWPRAAYCIFSVMPSRRGYILGRWVFLSRHSHWFRTVLLERIAVAHPGSEAEGEGFYLIAGSSQEELSGPVKQAIIEFITSAAKRDLSDEEKQFLACCVLVWANLLETHGRNDISVDLWSRVLRIPSLEGHPHKFADAELKRLTKAPSRLSQSRKVENPSEK